MEADGCYWWKLILLRRIMFLSLYIMLYGYKVLWTFLALYFLPQFKFIFLIKFFKSLSVHFDLLISLNGRKVFAFKSKENTERPIFLEYSKFSKWKYSKTKLLISLNTHKTTHSIFILQIKYFTFRKNFPRCGLACINVSPTLSRVDEKVLRVVFLFPLSGVLTEWSN